MEKLQIVNCDLCGSPRCKDVFTAPHDWERADFEPSTDMYGRYGTIVRCLDCGHYYTNPRPGAGFLASGYESVTDGVYLSESESRCINAYMSLATLRRHKPSGKLLEIGCFAGFFLNAARTSYDVQGLEPCSWAADYAENQLRLPIIRKTLEEADLPPASYDAIALIDVLEHLPSPSAVVKRCAAALKTGGVLYAVTPDIRGPVARAMGGYWWGLRPSHIHYFHRASLAKMLGDAGFEIKFVKSYGKIFTYSYWLSRIKNYPRWVYKTAEACIDFAGVSNKFLYIDTHDSLEFVAIKK